MTDLAQDLTDLYNDTKACAQLVGLHYVSGDETGITRVRHGKGFSYTDDKNKSITDRAKKQRIAELAIPPAWHDVWICPTPRGHILATGIDNKSRKQYIYHPKWRTMRDLIKFYRLIIFAKALPKIRQNIAANLQRPNLDREKVLGVMLWLLDNTYLRIGNDIYFEQNDSIGLTTLSDKNLIVAGPVITLSFLGKSGKSQQITFEDKLVASIFQQLIRQRGSRLFRYPVGTAHVNVEAVHINTYLHEITNQQISAKDFRTWGGTLLAFDHLVAMDKRPDDKTPSPQKVIVEAVDNAANVLGNTRAIAKTSYVHPDILATYTQDNFGRYLEKARQQPTIRGLDSRESQLVHVLELLFENEFKLLKNQ